MRTDEPITCNRCALANTGRERCPFVRASFPPGHIFFHQGDSPQAAHFVSRGLVLLSATDEDGNLLRQALRPAGTLLDAQVARRAIHRATATAVTSVDACVLALSSLDAWMGPRQSPSRAVLELALAEAQATEREALRARRHATARVASFLLEHAEVERPLEIQQQLVAGLLGLRPETLSRALAKLRETGAIGGRRRIRIVDARALAQAAESSSE